MAAATRVEIDLEDGDVLGVPTVPAPSSLGPVAFYATMLPAADIPPRPSNPATPRSPLVARLIGFDAEGNVVACLVPATAVDGVSPLSDCE